MEKELQMLLVPGSSNLRISGSSAYKFRVAEIMKAMSELVTILRFADETGNSKVRDNKGVVFFCNTKDLKNRTEYISFFNEYYL
ncbi:hypothetical protein HDE69_002656 [Pedobacter cryoconitis]|uniref:Uncharacterized protein n=1 Tax=Pedobacter cryoconitis TaxID=188932 RepID=A0A7W9DKX9_9SPHI|nr:hypothetical protein [Pedobacter cryoconitis]MBB5621595.1 hypothetical protein [Pedobacter cryoconitis]